MSRTPVSRRLPDFPWDALLEHGERARAHPDGIVDLSVGTPVDPTPMVAQRALAAATDAPGYPVTAGTSDLVAACRDWLRRRCGVLDEVDVLPVVGTKELIATAASQLGLGPGDVVVHPALAYPTYAVGAMLAGAEPVAADDLGEVPAADLVWLNSPSNPTGAVLTREQLRAAVAWCRERGAMLVSDECYVECGWDVEPLSVLHPSVCDGDVTGLLAVHSLSKRSNLAGYRCGFVAGDPALVRELLAVRKNLGLMLPTPQQAVMTAVLADDDHVAQQRERYAARRELLRTAFVGAGFRVDHSQASLYLWLTRGEDCWATVSWLADRGILVAPGSFYGPAGGQHVRVAFTATDERVAAAVARLR